MLTLPMTQPTMLVEKIDSNMGYVQIQLDEVEIVSRYDIILYLINSSEILEILDEVEITIDFLELIRDRKELVKIKINDIRNEVHTIMPHRFKRGLLIGMGTVLKWIYGTMDADVRKDIQNHLLIINKNKRHNKSRQRRSQIKN